MQTRLLTVLDENPFRRLGSNKDIYSDFRLVAATNRNLKAAVAQGMFREDLFFRIEVLDIHIPPLRERLEDFEWLVQLALTKIQKSTNSKVTHATQAAIEKLQQYAWPGNVRELINVIQRSAIFSESTVLDAESIELPEAEEYVEIGSSFLELGAVSETEMPISIAPKNFQGHSLKSVLAEVEKDILRQTLDLFGGDVVATANALKLSHPSVYQKARKYGLPTMKKRR